MNEYHSYIGLIILYNKNPVPINKININYLIGTNVLVDNNSHIISVPIDMDTPKPIKYKTIIRKYCKNELKMKLKNIIRIKHLNNIDSYHNYLIIIKPNKYLNSITNIITSSNNFKMYWKTFYDIYSHTQNPFNLNDAYKTFTKAPTKLKINDIYSIKIEDIYPTLALYYV